MSKLLFICSRNKWRSLTAETVLNGVGGHEVRSAGTEPQARVRVTEGHIGWADVIFVMEKKHLRRMQEKFPHVLSEKRVICLYIPDEYEYMNADLIQQLQAAVIEYMPME